MTSVSPSAFCVFVGIIGCDVGGVTDVIEVSGLNDGMTTCSEAGCSETFSVSKFSEREGKVSGTEDSGVDWRKHDSNLHDV